MALSYFLGTHPEVNTITGIVRSSESGIAMEQALSQKLKEIEREAVKRSIALMLNELYDWEKDSLVVDIGKVALLVNDCVHTKPSERLRLLCIYWWIVDTYFEGNVEQLVEMCKRKAPLKRQHL